MKPLNKGARPQALGLSGNSQTVCDISPRDFAKSFQCGMPAHAATGVAVPTNSVAVYNQSEPRTRYITCSRSYTASPSERAIISSRWPGS
jgi:hypothetical protein